MQPEWIWRSDAADERPFSFFYLGQHNFLIKEKIVTLIHQSSVLDIVLDTNPDIIPSSTQKIREPLQKDYKPDRIYLSRLRDGIASNFVQIYTFIFIYL